MNTKVNVRIKLHVTYEDLEDDVLVDEVSGRVHEDATVGEPGPVLDHRLLGVDLTRRTHVAAFRTIHGVSLRYVYEQNVSLTYM